jgi:hypothetical protein
MDIFKKTYTDIEKLNIHHKDIKEKDNKEKEVV